MPLNKSSTYALIGASSNPEKYGNIILHDLHDNGYHILPVNPQENSIDGIACYKNLTEIPEKIDVVIFVVPPQIAREVLEEVVELGIKQVRFQPWSESEEARALCEEKGLQYSFEKCIMVERRLNA